MLSIDDRGPPPPCPSPFNLAAYVLGPAAAQPDKVAVARIGPARAERWSYGKLERAVGGLAAALLARGLTPGARVVLRLGNDLTFPVAFLAAAAADLVPVVVSAALTEAELEGVLAQTDPALILADRNLPLPETAVPVVSAGDLPGLWETEPVVPALGDPDRPGYIVFTSGTSGQPRAVVHAHRAVWARRMMWDGWYGLRETDRLLHAGAFNWTYTLGTGLLDPWAAGATALVPAEGVTPDQLPLLMARHQATLFAAAPGIYRRMLKGGGPIAVPTLRHGLSAGEKLPATLRARWEAATGCGVHEAFGMSECSTFLSGAPDRPAPDGTLGFAQPGRRIAVTDAEGAPVPRGDAGIIAVDRGDPGLMLGYRGHEDEAEGRMRGDWFLTGDMGEMRPDGAVIYHGRADDMMNAGGVRVSPLEVEAVLAQFPGVQDCAAVEVPLKPEVTVIAAFVVCEGALDEPAIRAHMSEKLAQYKTPRIYVGADALPRNTNGKLMRRALRDAYERRHGQT